MHELKQKIMIGVRRSLNRAGLRTNKVFAIGFNKTGTTSMHALFESLGRPSYHGVRWRECDNPWLLRQYDCFSDGIPKDFTKLDRMYPHSKFILHVRELDSWIYSRLAHIERQKEQNNHCASLLWDNTEYSVKHWIKERNTHHLAVLSYFAERPSDLLVINYIRDASSATRICNFLGNKGNYDRPRENTNPENAHPSSHIEMLHKCIVDLGIQQHELGYDILCPSLIEKEIISRFPADTSQIP